MKRKKVLCLALASVMALSAVGLSGCGGKGSSADNEYKMWIYGDDGQGTFYEKYEENPAIQWLNQQYWDVENGGLGTKDNGTALEFSFQTPITGAEADNFNTMLSTGEYPEMIDMSMAGSAQSLYEDGILIELTEYVDKYMPNLKKLLEEDATIRAKAATYDEDGNAHYYSLPRIADGRVDPWGGYMYRRDWVVKYATPTSHVWDWDSDYVKEHGHPAVTPLEEAKASGNMEGWKVNEVTSFSKDDGDDVNNTYTDNVIFPSGKTDPYTISDWEWMFEAFQKAIDARSFKDDTNAYATTIYYPGYLQVGDLVSSFGGGNGSVYVDPDGKVSFSGTSENFKTYLECLNSWSNKGWLDSKFETRTSDSFFTINQNGYSQGMVGMWYGGIGTVGDMIRVTCTDPDDQKDAFVMGCAVPINDVYGGEAQKYIEPDCMYQDARVAGGFGLTNKVEDKSEESLKALFTCLDWLYSEEGGMWSSVGLSEEQIASADISNNLWEKNGVKASYEKVENDDGTFTIHYLVDPSSELSNATKGNRFMLMQLTGHPEDGHYTMETGRQMVTDRTIDLWVSYYSTGLAMDYNGRFTDEENKQYDKINNTLNDYMAQTLPTLIKNGLDGWDEYVAKINEYDPEPMNQVYQKYVDQVMED